MKYKFIPTGDASLLDSPISHDIIGNVDLDNIDLVQIISNGPLGQILFKAESEEEEEKINNFMENFIREFGKGEDRNE